MTKSNIITNLSNPQDLIIINNLLTLIEDQSLSDASVGLYIKENNKLFTGEIHIISHHIKTKINCKESSLTELIIYLKKEINTLCFFKLELSNSIYGFLIL